MHKLGVIVPFRDRYEHLVEFKSKIVEYLNKKNIQYELIIVTQNDFKEFNNRGITSPDMDKIKEELLKRK